MVAPPHGPSRTRRSSRDSCGERKSTLWCCGCFRHSSSSNGEEPLAHVEEPDLVDNSRADELSVESQVQQFSSKEQEFRPLTLKDVKILLDLVTHQVALSGSQSTASSKLLTNCLSQYEERKEALTDLIKGVHKEVKQRVIGGSRNVLMPLLTSAVGGAGSLHWVGFGLRLIAWSLENMHDTMQNRQDCLSILREVVDFMKSLFEIWEKTTHDYEDSTNPALQKIIEIVFSCAIICTSTINDPAILRYIDAQRVKATVENMEKDLLKAKADALLYMSKWQICERPKIPQQVKFDPELYSFEKVGEDKGKSESLEFLSMDSNDMIAVCLHGMGGIGKSFMGLEIFTEFPGKTSVQYRPCRVELELDIKVEKLVDIQKQILRKLCGPDASNDISDCLEGRSKLMQEMKAMNDPIFLYVDNVLDCDHLHTLLPKASCFPKGSKLLVTSRGKDILGGIKALGIKLFKLIEITLLEEKEAKELLWKQIGEERDEVIVSSSEPLEALEKTVIKLCGGLPLALTVVGGCIASNQQGPADVRVWKRVVEAMEKAEPLSGKEQDSLYVRIGYSIECLECNVKRAFLDIVFFVDSMCSWRIIKRLVRDSHLHILRKCNLVQKVQVFERSDIKIHDVLVAIARKKISNDTNELRIAGTNNFDRLTGDDLGKVVSLSRVRLDASMLTQMPHLRYLNSVTVEGECTKLAQLCELVAVHNLHSEMGKLFNLGGCAHLKYISWHDAEHNASDLELLRHQAALEVVYLESWKNLEDVRAIETLKSLKRLKFRDCPEISRLPQGIASLTKLQKLSLKGCQCLPNLPEGVTGLTGLDVLDLSYCTSLERLPEKIGNLKSMTRLFMDGCCAIACLPDGVSGLEGLSKLSLRGCTGLQCLSDGISGLTRLEVLNLNNCENLQCLPEAGVEGLQSLRKLTIRGCTGLGFLPRGIAGLTSLKRLDLDGCSRLKSLPEELVRLSTCLAKLSLAGCNSLPHELPHVVQMLTSLTSLSLSGCRNLESIEAITTLTSLTDLDLGGCRALQTLPAGFSRLTGLTRLNLEGASSLNAGLHQLESLTGLKSVTLCDSEAMYTLMKEGTFCWLQDKVNSTSRAAVSWSRCLPYLPESLTTFTSMECLEFDGQGVDLPCLPQELTSLTTLKWLRISNCQNAQTLPRGFTRLRSLQELTWKDCTSLKWLPELAGLTGLEFLQLSGCTSRDIHSTLKEVWALTGLRELFLEKWQNMWALPTGVSSLTRLERLKLTGCASLVSLPEELASLTSLWSLSLADCESLECLPLALSASHPGLCVDLTGCKAMADRSTDYKRTLVGHLLASHPTLFQARGYQAP